MVEIKFILVGRTVLFPCCTHIAAVITDLKTSQNFLVNYPFHSTASYPLRENKQVANTFYDSSKRNTCCIKTVTLYSEKSFDLLKKSLDREFSDNWQFKWLKNNCSHKAYRVLEVAFNLAEEDIYTMHTCYNWICGIFCMASCGILSSCCLTPPPWKTPEGVFSLANWLSLKYGALTPGMQEVIAIKESKEIKDASSTSVSSKKEATDPVERTYEKLNSIGIH